MTASVSWRSPAAFHICPESRIIGGIDASMMMSLGTCRLVMPRSESTIASAGPSCSRAEMAPSMAARSASGSAATRLSTSARPSLGFTPMRSNVSPYFENTSAKYVFTAWPKMIGSETFIIVALRWIENSTPCAWDAAICSARNASRLRALMKVASTISPARTGIDSFSTVTEPSLATSSTFRSSSAAKVTDCSLERKSSWPMVATLVFESFAHAPILCGCERA